MDEVEKFLNKVRRVELAVLIGILLVAVGMLAYFDPSWRVCFFTLLVGVAVLVVLGGFASVVAKWEVRRLVELIKKDAKGREENVEQKGS